MSTIGTLVDGAAQAFIGCGISDPRLEARYLVSGCLGISVTESFMWPERNVAGEDEAAINMAINRRCAHEPGAYIKGKREFYGRNFRVDPRVLIPRPETELLVQLVIDRVKGLSKAVRITDVGTGSGNIAITLALEIPDAVITAIDISDDALDVARGNAVKYNVGKRIRFLSGDLLSPLTEATDIVVANLPYISDNEFLYLSPEITRFEPALALHGGIDGIQIIERLIAQAGNSLHNDGSIYVEVGAGQTGLVKQLIGKYYASYRVQSFHDLNGIERVLEIDLVNNKGGIRL